MNNKLITILSLFFFILLISFMVYIFNVEHSLSCTGSMTQKKFYPDYTVSSQLNHSIFETTASGYDTIQGNVMVDNDTYSVSRIIEYSVSQPGASYRTIKIKSVKKTHKDNLPDEIASKFFPYLLDFNDGLIRLDRISKNLFIVSTPAAPIVLCYSD